MPNSDVRVDVSEPMSLAKQVEHAQREVRSWSKGKRESVQLEGPPKAARKCVDGSER